MQSPLGIESFCTLYSYVGTVLCTACQFCLCAQIQTGRLTLLHPMQSCLGDCTSSYCIQSYLGRMTSTLWPSSWTARPSAVTTSPMPPTWKGNTSHVCLSTTTPGKATQARYAFQQHLARQHKPCMPFHNNLERQHKPYIPFHNNNWKGNTSHVCLSTKTPGKATQAMYAFQQHRAGQRDGMTLLVHAIHDHQLTHHMESTCHCFWVDQL